MKLSDIVNAVGSFNAILAADVPIKLAIKIHKITHACQAELDAFKQAREKIAAKGRAPEEDFKEINALLDCDVDIKITPLTCAELEAVEGLVLKAQQVSALWPHFLIDQDSVNEKAA